MNETKSKAVIVSSIQQIPDYKHKIKDLELILMICLYIENLKIINSQNKIKKIDKTMLFVNICHEVFDITPDSQEIIDLKSSAQFLIDHKKVVKFGFLKKNYLTTKNYLKI